MAPPSYANITLTSMDGDLSVVVYTPEGIMNLGGDADQGNSQTSLDNLPPFYVSSRFDHGSMIGSITRTRRYINAVTGETIAKTHVLYGTDTWRVPHNSQWPESGVGLASEFGVGDDGNLCYFRCGWKQAMNVTNGLLGYQEAENGGPFLKIGVGRLIKGTCTDCDSTDIYKFNSPYLFDKHPEWKLTHLSQNSKSEINSLQLQHEEILDEFGYQLTKDISLEDNILSVTTKLLNLGRDAFSTVWYSHHLFSCDGLAIGPGYALDLNLQGLDLHPLYNEPGTWSWSSPLDQYAQVTPYPQSVHVNMRHTLDAGTRIKSEFVDDSSTSGGFTINSCGMAVEATLESPQWDPSAALDSSNVITMYDYNLYVERGTLSPEPQFLIKNLQSRQSVEWTLRLVIRDSEDDAYHQEDPNVHTHAKDVAASEILPALRWTNLNDIGIFRRWNGHALENSSDFDHSLQNYILSTGLLISLSLTTLLMLVQRHRRRNIYQTIP